MAEFVTIPENWEEIEYDIGPSRGDGPHMEQFEAMWVSTDDEIRVSSRHSVDANGAVTYPIMVEQRLQKDGLRSVFQTHARVADDRQEAEQMAVSFMETVDAGQHRLRILAVDQPDDSDFVQFYTISDSELPGSMTGEQIVDIIDSEDSANDIGDLPDDVTRELAEDEMIQVDIFPRHEDEVHEVNE